MYFIILYLKVTGIDKQQERGGEAARAEMGGGRAGTKRGEKGERGRGGIFGKRG